MKIEEMAEKAGMVINEEYAFIPANIIFKLTEYGLMIRKYGSDKWDKVNGDTSFKAAGEVVYVKSLFKEEENENI